MGGVLDFICSNFAGVDDSSYVDDGGVVVSHNFADFGLAQVDVFDSFVGDGGRPGYGGLIFVVDDCGVGRFGHTEVGGAMLDVEKFEEALIGDHDLGLTGALCGSVLAD